MPVVDAAHTLSLNELFRTTESRRPASVAAEQDDDAQSLKTLFDSYYQTIEQDKQILAQLQDDGAVIRPDQLLQSQLTLAKLHFREELLAKTVGKISQNIDMVIKSQ